MSPRPTEALFWPEAERFAELRRDARMVSAHLRLCLQRRSWRGTVGNWSGAGTGTSIDFQDHRPYLPGDDPRHIDWAAYARSGNYIMKLYREEVSPRMDLILDLSRSMTWNAEKRDRVLTLACFCVESASALGATVRLTAVAGTSAHFFSPEALAAGFWQAPSLEPRPGAPALATLPLQPGSLRVLLSDLLYEAAPVDLLRPLLAGKGRAAILCPFLREESDPDWNGNMELVDCETGTSRRQRVDPVLLQRYQTAYARHFAEWRDACRRYDAPIARVACHDSVADSLRAEALPKGVVEPWA